MNPRSVIAIVAFAVIAGCADASSPTRQAPSASSSVSPIPEIARLFGIGVTWLPPHFETDGADVTPAAHGSSASQDFRGPAGETAAPRLSLLVERGAPSVLDLSAKNGFPTVPVTIRGHVGVLASLPADGTPDFPAPTYYLQWVEQPGLTLTISATFGAAASDAKRMAAGLVVHPGLPNLPSAEDEAQIRQAFADAYTGGRPDATVLAAIENGKTLGPVLADFKKREPTTARTVRVTVDRVTFGDTSHADVTYSLSFERPGSTGISGGQGAVKVDGRWKVTQRGFCMLIAITGIACP